MQTPPPPSGPPHNPYAPYGASPPPQKRGLFVGSTARNAIIAVVIINVLLIGVRILNQRTGAHDAELRATMPHPGAKGTLHANQTMRLCHGKNVLDWGWPCHGNGSPVADGATVSIARAEVVRGEALCRYSVAQPFDQGDAPCAWFMPN